MSDVSYVVRVKYETDTSAAASGIDSLSHKMGGLSGTLDGAKGLIDGFVGKLAALGTAFAGAAAVGGVLALKKGLVDVNAQLEDSTIGFATIFSMLGASDFDTGLNVAKGLIADIRKDAAALPGEFQDFVGMAQTLSAPLLNAGKGVKEIRDLTRQTAIAGAAMLGGNFDEAARQMAMLIEGRAGTHNILGMRAGITAHTQVNGKNFNDATADERLKFINEKFSKNDAALKAYEKSWKGLTSSIADDAKALYGRATAPLFEKLKEQFKRADGLLKSEGFSNIADRVGSVIGHAFDRGVEATDWIAAHWSTIATNAQKFRDRLVEAFEKIKPIAENLAGIIAANPGGIAQGLLGARLAMTAAPMVGEVAGAAGVAGGAALAGAAAALIGVFDLLTSSVADMPPALQEWTEKAREMWASIKTNLSETWDNLKQVWDDLMIVFRPVVDFVGLVLIQTFRDLSTAAVWLSGKLKQFTSWLATLPGLAKYFEVNDEDQDPSVGHMEGLGSARKAAWMAQHIEVGEEAAVPISKIQAEAVAKALKQADAMKGAGKMNVTVNAPLTVLSDADPERIAKSVATHVDSAMRNALTSRSLTAFRAF